MKKYCKKCFKKLICIHKEPEMSAIDILETINKSDDKLNEIYYFLIPEYRAELGGKKGFHKFIKKFNFDKFKFKFIEIDDCLGYAINNNIRIDMQRAYNYLDDKPIYDRFSKIKLELFWRITKINVI